MKRVCALLFLLGMLSIPAEAAGRQGNGVVSCEAMERALELSLTAREQEDALSWLELLALAAAYGEGVPSPVNVVHVHYALEEGTSAEEVLDGRISHYRYWLDAYEAVLGGIVGNYTERTDGAWEECYGMKACFPVADGYWYTYENDGVSDCMLVGLQGTPVVAIESGTVETMERNRYNGWQIGIRSADGRRRCRYSCLRSEMPFPREIRRGKWVEAGQVIGFMGHSGSGMGKSKDGDESAYLRFEVQQIGGKKHGTTDWFEPLELLRLLEKSKSAVVYENTSEMWKPLHPRMDLDVG